ncbi:MAG TPA: hypothetical protein VHB30_12230, partial [Solirubrobacteraceae bacterium]|nr:hypothetical protein [Solirubrobacteraceae bacterium]
PSAPAAPARSAWQPATRQTATKQATRQASTKQASSKPAPRTSSSSSKSSSGGKSKACSALELPTLTSGSGSGLVGYVAATGDTHDAACGVGATTRVAVASVVTLSTSAGKEIAQIAVDRGDLFRFSLVPGSYRLSVRVPGSKGRDDCGGVLKVTAGHTTQATCVVGLG